MTIPCVRSEAPDYQSATGMVHPYEKEAFSLSLVREEQVGKG